MTILPGRLPGRDVPRVSLLGLAILVFGVAADAFVHLALAPEHGQAGFAPPEHAAHLIVLIGMLLVLAGIAADGARRQWRRAREREGRSIRAHR